jgi:hypothetical protein
MDKNTQLITIRVMPDVQDVPVRVFDQHFSHEPGFGIGRAEDFCAFDFDGFVIFIDVIYVECPPGTLMPLITLTKENGGIAVNHAAESRRFVPTPTFFKTEYSV